MTQHSNAEPRQMIRVLIVDASLVFRAALKAELESDTDIRVVGQARNGAEAVDLVLRLQPDLVTVDVLMPESDGFEAVEQIMAQRPTPIVVITSVDRQAIVFRTLAAGALDVVTKPKVGACMRPIIDRVKSLAQARPRRTGVPSQPLRAPAAKTASRGNGPEAAAGPLVVLASSAGGPQALMQVLSGLPADLPAPVLVVQHIAAGFAQGLAQWLDQSCALPVQLAEADQVPPPGAVLIAPDNAHLVLGPGRRIILDRRTSPAAAIRPAADLTLGSAAGVCGEDMLAVVLTGMGRDGAAGVKAVKANGGRVIVQDKATSFVLPMSAAANPELLSEVAAGLSRYAGFRFNPMQPSVLLQALQNRVRASRLATAAAYLRRLRDDETEWLRLAEAVAIHETSFFRHGGQFRVLSEIILPELIRLRARERQLRLWSAAGQYHGHRPKRPRARHRRRGLVHRAAASLTPTRRPSPLLRTAG
jgi:two-component system chemotaxis response regulator CheB